MSERRTPYTTARLPRTPWPGETAANFTPPDELELLARQMRTEAIHLKADNDHLRQRLTALETAARAVVEAYEREDELLLLFREIEALGRVLGEVER